MNTSENIRIIKVMADYIEKGAIGRTQIRGNYIGDGKNQDYSHCCAIGAAALGAGYEDAVTLSKFSYGVVSYLGEAVGVKDRQEFYVPSIPYPLVATTDNPELHIGSLHAVIVTMNDTYGWSFSQIVSYLREVADGMAEVMEAANHEFKL